MPTSTTQTSDLSSSNAAPTDVPAGTQSSSTFTTAAPDTSTTDSPIGTTDQATSTRSDFVAQQVATASSSTTGSTTIGDAGSARQSASTTIQNLADQTTTDRSVNSETAAPPAGANATTPHSDLALTTARPHFGNDTNTDPTPNVVPATSTSTSSSRSAWLPTALITAATTVSNSSVQATGVDPTSSAQATGAPSTPKIITPADGLPNTPSNSTLIRIGFLESLNYPFVVQNSVTVAQIFQVLPLAVSYALQVPGSEVTVRSLQPYPVSSYIATVALLWIPQDQVNSLQIQILATNSRLYSQSDPTAQQLVNLIDPTIPLLADSATANAGTSSAGTSNSDSNSNLSDSGANSGSLDNGPSQDSSTSSSATVKQLAIGIGAAAAAIGYAALMFLGARRFRRQSALGQIEGRHSRVSSITGERAASPPFAQSYRSSGGSSGRAVRGQNISAPLMTENSLLL